MSPSWMQEPDACLEDVEDIDASNLLEIEEREEITPIRGESASWQFFFRS